MIQLKNRFGKVEAAYAILTHVVKDSAYSGGETSAVASALSLLEREMCELDKAIHQCVHNVPLIISQTEWARNYHAKRKAL